MLDFVLRSVNSWFEEVRKKAVMLGLFFYKSKIWALFTGVGMRKDSLDSSAKKTILATWFCDISWVCPPLSY